MNKNDLDILLEKFYRGETTLDEEQQLRESLMGDDADALLMQGLKQMDSEVDVPEDFEASLSDMIDQWQDEEKQEAKVAPALWRRVSWWVAAACVAIIATVGLWHMRNHKQAQFTENNAPVIAENTKVGTSTTVETPPQDEAKQEQQSSVLPIQHIDKKAQRQAMPAAAFRNKVENLAQAKVNTKPQVKAPAQPEVSISDEDIAIAALEKFATTLDRGVDQLNEAGKKFDNINNTIKQYL